MTLTLQFLSCIPLAVLHCLRYSLRRLL